MDYLTNAINTKFLDSTLYNLLGGRAYFRKAVSNEYPHLVYTIVTGNPDNAFAKKGETILIQFSLYSTESAGNSAMQTLYNALRTLLDDCTLTISAHTLAAFQWQGVVCMDEEVDALPDGSTTLLYWPVDFLLTIQDT